MKVPFSNEPTEGVPQPDRTAYFVPFLTAGNRWACGSGKVVAYGPAGTAVLDVPAAYLDRRPSDPDGLVYIAVTLGDQTASAPATSAVIGSGTTLPADIPPTRYFAVAALSGRNTVPLLGYGPLVVTPEWGRGITDFFELKISPSSTYKWFQFEAGLLTQVDGVTVSENRSIHYFYNSAGTGELRTSFVWGRMYAVYDVSTSDLQVAGGGLYRLVVKTRTGTATLWFYDGVLVRRS